MKLSRPLLLFALPLALGWGCFGAKESPPPAGNAGASGAGNAVCAADVDNEAECNEADLALSCENEVQCCRCVSQPPCGNLWTCVEPALLPAGCPMAPPAADTPCAIDGLACEYCTNAGPVVMSCSAVRGTDPVELSWGPGHLGMCAE